MSRTPAAKRVEKEPSAAPIALTGVGVKYRLLTDAERTLKGRLLNALRGNRHQALDFWALREINLVLEKGQVIGILGRNGSGKTTLLRVMSGVIAPSEGNMALTGRVSPILDLSGVMNPELSGRENGFLFGALNRVPRDKMASLMPRVIEFAELGPFFEVPLKTYSAGMVARLAFSLATLLDPEVLLIDEILAVGDEQFQRKSFFRMRKLIERGSLVVIVSHNTMVLEQLCNRVILLDGGRVVADGGPAKILADYRRSLDLGAGPRL
jgi:ABC-type polysaccharide/polyol phosphate transport system ATPase subunit